MRGFQPAAQRAAQQKKGYADGGMVRGPGSGTSDEVPEEVAEGSYIMPADSTREVGEEALERMGARGFPIGGASVPVNLSNGEFKMPPEQVHAIGVQALDQIKTATHQPTARGFAPAARALAARHQEPEPRQFFADGGLVEDERRPLGAPAPASAAGLSTPPAAPTARGFAPGAAALAPAPAPAPAPVSIGNVPRGFRPGAEGFGTSAADPAPSPAPAAGAPSARGFSPGAAAAAPAPLASSTGPRGFAPGAAAFAARTAGTAAPAPAAAPQTRGFPLPTAAPAPVPATEVEGWRTKAVMDGAAEDAKQAWDRGNVAGAAGAVARGALTAIPTAVGEFAYNTAAPLLGVARGFGEGLMGMANEPAAPAAAPAATPMGAGRGRVNPPAANPAAPAPASPLPPAPAASEVMPGVFRVGSSFGDSAAAAQAGAVPRGLPSAQNLAAANALAAQQSEPPAGGYITRGFVPGMRPPPAESSARGFAPAFSGVIGPPGNGNMWSRTPDQQRQDAATQATSIHRPTAALGAAALHGLDAQALEQTRGANGLAQEAMRQSGALDREGLQQGGANAREALRAGVDLQRVGVEGQRVGLEGRKVNSQVEAQGYANRALAQQEQLRSVLADPNASVPAKVQAQKALRAMAGVKDSAKDRFLTVGGGQSVTKDGQTIKDPAQVYDTETGQWLQAPGQGGAGPIDQNAQALSIRDDPKMTREQKVEALRKLGYS